MSVVYIGQVNATVFIVFLQCLLFYNSKKYPVLVYPVIFPVQFLSPATRFWPIYAWLQTDQQYSSFFLKG